MMECKFAIYCDFERATKIKIHNLERCGHHKKHGGNDNEWFYARTYENARIIAKLLSDERKISLKDCEHCKPSNS